MKCKICGEKLSFDSERGETTTLLGYSSPEGHNHDDNCIVRLYKCINNHEVRISIINSCGCGWTGKKECFCSMKVYQWPELKGGVV